MLTINIGMPRSGTLWRYKLIRDLVIADGGKDGLQIRKQYLLNLFLSGENADINTLSVKRLLPVIFPSVIGENFTINTHAKPSSSALFLLEQNRIKAVYGYRDPRDCILSMLEYSERALPQYSSTFLKLKDIEQAVKFFQTYLIAWEGWLSAPNTLLIQYENMLEEFDSTINNIVQHLGIELPEARIEKIKDQYRPKQKSTKNIHFQYGIAQRHKQEFTEQELNFLSDQLGPYLEKMGYAT